MAPRTNAAPDPERQLMIKTKACQRLLKEVSYYEKEVKENEEKLAKMKEENRDPYDIKKFEEVLGESYMMIPNSKGRLESALEDLASYVGSDEVNDHQNGEWYGKAQELLLSEKERIEKAQDVPDTTPLNNLKDGEAF